MLLALGRLPGFGDALAGEPVGGLDEGKDGVDGVGVADFAEGGNGGLMEEGFGAFEGAEEGFRGAIVLEVT